MKNKNETLTRRAFLTGVCAVFGMASCAVTRTYSGVARDGNFTGILSDYPELSNKDGAIILTVEGFPGPIAIININGSDLRAVSAVCAHQGCTVDVSKNFLICPCHGSTYTLQGEVVRGPAQRGLQHYPLDLHNGYFTIEM
jgi:Rieske Fe-S protein